MPWFTIPKIYREINRTCFFYKPSTTGPPSYNSNNAGADWSQVPLIRALVGLIRDTNSKSVAYFLPQHRFQIFCNRQWYILTADFDDATKATQSCRYQNNVARILVSVSIGMWQSSQSLRKLWIFTWLSILSRWFKVKGFAHSKPFDGLRRVFLLLYYKGDHLNNSDLSHSMVFFILCILRTMDRKYFGSALCTIRKRSRVPWRLDHAVLNE